MSVTLEQLGDFLRQTPPRDVPGNIRRRKLSGLLGRTLYFVGWPIAIFGLVFLAIFFPWRLVSELRLDWGTVKRAEGELVGSEKTSMTVGGGDHGGGTPIYRLRFAYTHPRQGRVTGVCYRTGSGEKVGKQVPVEYIEASPAACRIEGCRLNAFGYATSFVAIFPMVGLCLVYFSWRARRRAAHLLRDGVFAFGNVTGVQATNVTVNNQRRHRVTVSWEADGQQLSTSYNAYGEEVELAQSHLAGGEKVGLLYDPARPGRVLLAETLLGRRHVRGV